MSIILRILLEVTNTLKTWFGKLSANQISWARLPLKKGGLGLTPSEQIREAAFNKSKQQAMERPVYLSAPVCGFESSERTPMLSQGESQTPTDEPTSEELYHQDIRDRLMETPRQADIIRAASTKGNYKKSNTITLGCNHVLN